ncbi:hypothetical protein ACFSPU_06880 [Haoranjiania flava]|uniref:Uncharacterized protein n=1 Tax=Haoranjiania flava TaxID=1856322 RepID=A0AAE3IM46_9BACT|nr:hypothetical protein [Haoranjiania flava]MCU7694099.1 hypothetical protein [Haoranjiania flava]
MAVHQDNQLSTFEKERQEQLETDIRYNRVSTSRFLFYISVFALVAFLFAGCFQLYKNRYKGKPDIEIQPSTKYVPEYK